MAKTEKERAKEIINSAKKSILTETKEEEKKEGGDEHGPELYAGVEEREGGSRGRKDRCGGGRCQHDGQSGTGQGKKQLEQRVDRVVAERV